MTRDKSSHIAAPIAFTVDRESYVLSPLRIVDFRELELHLRKQVVDEVKCLVEGLPAEVQKEHLSDAVSRARKIKIGNDEFQDAVKQLAGLSYMLWLALKKSRPTMTLDQCVELITEHADVIAPAIAQAADPGDPNPQAPATTNALPAPSTSSGSIAT